MKIFKYALSITNTILLGGFLLYILPADLHTFPLLIQFLLIAVPVWGIGGGWLTAIYDRPSKIFYIGLALFISAWAIIPATFAFIFFILLLTIRQG